MNKKKQWLEEEEFKQCTFKPDIRYTDEFLKEINISDGDKPVVERALLWAKNKESKIAEELKKKSEREIEDCTFKPNIQPLSVPEGEQIHPKGSIKSIEKYLEWMYVLRYQKDSQQ